MTALRMCRGLYVAAIFVVSLLLSSPSAVAAQANDVVRNDMASNNTVRNDIARNDIVGIATPLRDGASAPVLYEEFHTIDADGLHRKVSYRRAGSEFASKTVDYSADAIAPVFVQHDDRQGEMIAARRDARAGVELGYRENSKTAERWQRIESSQRPLVIDAGFDNFVRRHWQALQRGEKLHFDFAVPSRAQAVHLVIAATGVADCGEPRLPQGLCFRVYAGNYVVRLFFPALHLLYDTDGQLQRFMGLSNISDDGGDGQQVRIDYRYHAATP